MARHFNITGNLLQLEQLGNGQATRLFLSNDCSANLALSVLDKLVSPQRHVLKNGWRGTSTSLAI